MEGAKEPAGTAKRPRDDQEEGPSKRRNVEAGSDRRSRMPQILHTRPHDLAKSFTGGERVKLQANYFRLLKTPEWNIYKYHVTFEPECLLSRLRNALIMQHKETIGGFLFDGTQLFVTRDLGGDRGVVNLTSKTRTDEEYTLKLQFTKVVQMDEQESLQILNLILRRATAGLKLQLVGRNFYDAASKIPLNQFKIELWPGFATSIRKHEQDILLNCDVAHKVMRMDTAYDMLQELVRTDRGGYQNNFKQKALGLTVLTAYNNKTYRIDDVDFDISPMTTFDQRGKAVTLVDYYQEKYRLTIRDKNQPLLISRPKEKNIRGGSDKPIWLIPELCRITGLSEQQRNNIPLKNMMKPYSQMVGRTRKERLLQYNNRVRSTPESISVLREWNLDLEKNLVNVEGHKLKSEILYFGGNREHTVRDGGWDRECGRTLKLFQTSIELKRWYIIFPSIMERDVNRFVNRGIELAGNMGFQINKPRSVNVNNDRALAGEVDRLANTNPQMMFFVVTSNKNNNADVYSSIKKKCYGDNAIPSQVATKFNLTKDKGYDSIVTKIIIQMCAKLGGAPWGAKIPLGGVMTIGFDVSKDSQNKNMSYGCLVATMDLKSDFSFFATVSTYSSSETLSNEFSISVKKAIIAYRNKHSQLPRKIIIYRGGVGDGDIQYVKDMEVKNLETKLKEMYASAEQPLEMAFMIVTKKINARIFNGDRNPDCGTVVDDVITLAERYEFFLISASSTQGTVSPTNYNIIHDTSNLPPDKLQIWTYKHTHLYFNWCGTTKVPAVLQYATKLCFLVSNYMHRVPHNQLEQSLYFL
ncbi:protein piwi-like isoform X2 [Contarinia nasturtii]|uniref:protein piwi-like isoform X2 n=1 Tax=Contarinia nasturtii TaxID=265458 RepID=UPI0012D395D5|nr:protein piwi-like isoform X2 [Contarinia nasturtii]